MSNTNFNTVQTDDEKYLFKQVAAGNEQAFETLFNLFLSRLHPFIIKLTRSEMAVEEIIQETFIRVWLNRDKLEEIENPGGWLYKVASNECYTWLRKSALIDKFSQPVTAEPTPQNTTSEWLDVKELHRLVDKAIEQLPAQRKKIYQLSRNQGKTIPEIAAALQLSPNTVKNALVISLKTIREYLAKAGITISLVLLLFGKK